MIKICPDMITKETVEPMMKGQGAFERVVLKQCIKDQCAAYCKEDGSCRKYMNIVEESE